MGNIHTQAVARSIIEKPKYLDIIQQDPSSNIWLNKTEIKELCIDGIIYKQQYTNSFAQHYLDLHNKNMPVFITTDSMLNALHKFCRQIEKDDNIDITILHKMTDTIPKRKCPSVFDLVYTLFNNEKAMVYLGYQMESGGINYHSYLEQIKEEYNTYEFQNNVHGQNLNMLRAISCDKIDIFPFNSNAWGYKQLNTQVGGYIELLNNNTIYPKNEEPSNSFNKCQYLDIMIDPSPTFWRKMLVMIQLLKKIVTNDLHILDNFETVIIKLLDFLAQYLNKGQVDHDLIQDLKCIIKKGDEDGWYLKLFHSNEIAYDKSLEISSMFTGESSNVYIGTGNPQIMYINICHNNTNKIFLGPVYKTYEIITAPKEHITDEIWKEKHKEYEPLFH